MHRIDTKTAQKDKFGAGKNGFTRGNPQTGTPATDLDDDYFDMLQEELCSVVEASGASLEKGRHDQLLTALRALLLSRKNPFGDIKSDGTVKTALENLRLGAGAPAIGIPFFWPSAAMPNTVMTEWADMVFLKFNGATFSASTYPKLALVIPSLTLPDARGEFPRIWDDGRGVDSWRSLLSSQSSGAPNITGGMTSIGIVRGVSTSGAITAALSSDKSNLIFGSSSALCSFTFDASKSNSVYQSISEVRPRNIAFNFLVRAK
ncbi:integrase [Escherichia coli]|nr:integrase [Escherichia coli]